MACYKLFLNYQPLENLGSERLPTGLLAGLKSLFLMNSFALLTVVNTKPIWTPPPNPHPITVALNSNLLSSLLTLFDVSVRVVFFSFFVSVIRYPLS